MALAPTSVPPIDQIDDIVCENLTSVRCQAISTNTSHHQLSSQFHVGGDKEKDKVKGVGQG
jgi:hypothetical protein